jgi:hypothetical protein
VKSFQKKNQQDYAAEQVLDARSGSKCVLQDELPNLNMCILLTENESDHTRIPEDAITNNQTNSML